MAILDIPDQPLLPGLPLTYQHAAAAGPLILLWVLAHADRHPEPDATGPAAPRGRWAWLVRPLPLLVGLVLALALVRESYLAAAGKGGLLTGLGFFVLTVCMGLGVRYLNRPDPRPHAAQGQDAVRRAATAEDKEAAATAELVRLAGEHNADVALLDSLDRQADHAARAYAYDTNRQIPLAAEAVRAGLPEPLTTPLFPGDKLPAVPVDPDTTVPAPAPAARTRHNYERYVLGRPQAEAEAETEATPEVAEPPASKKAAARVVFEGEIGRADLRSSVELGRFFAERFDVHEATGRKWAAEFRREDPASRNGHGVRA
jgi:hypothetical protein